MNFGKLDRRIVIQRRALTKDASGTKVETWADESTVWAEKVKDTGTSRESAGAERDINAQQFRIRFRSIDPTEQRIFYDLKFYDIKGTTEEGRQVSLLIDTVAIQSIS